MRVIELSHKRALQEAVRGAPHLECEHCWRATKTEPYVGDRPRLRSQGQRVHMSKEILLKSSGHHGMEWVEKTNRVQGAARFCMRGRASARA